MSFDSTHDSSAEPSDALRGYCLRFVQFLAGTALDPHRYFEQKYAADVAQARTFKDLAGIMTALLDWLAKISITESALHKFDVSLQADRLPTLTMLRNIRTREAGLILAGGGIESSVAADIVRQALKDASLSASDQALAEQQLAEYDHD